MSRIFLSHHHSNNREALALKLWLESQGWRDEIFLDFDPATGIKTGTRWKEALAQANSRCEAIVCLISPDWMNSPECVAEYRTAENLWLIGATKIKIFVAQIAKLPSATKAKKSRSKSDKLLDRTSEWQRCQLDGEGPFTIVELGPADKPVQFATEGLIRLKLGLLEAGISGVLPKHFPWPPADDPKRAPYRGLRPFEFKDARVYFGRNAEILHGLAKLYRMRRAGDVPLFIILGASGTGKSSFLRAGLLPRLKNEDRGFYPLNVVRPQKQPLFGDRGLAHVIASANAELKLTLMNEGAVETELAKGPQACAELLHRIQQAAQTRLGKLADPAFPPTIILPVDQAEELFNADATSEARTFLDMIGAVVRGDVNGKRIQRVSLIVAFTIRSDRYEPLQTASELKGIEREVFDDLRPMPSTQFREVITGPANLVSANGRPLEIAEALVNRLVNDCTSGADTLPLLGLILEKLFRKYSNDGKLELRAYLEMGEMAKVISTEAESILSGDQIARQTELARLHTAFIPHLVTINRDNNQAMRRVALMSDLPIGSCALIQALIEKRLLVSDLRHGENVVEVAHESLFRQWKVLSEWIDEERDDLREYDRLKEEAKIWEEKGKKTDYLRTGERLSLGEALAEKPAYLTRPQAVSDFLKVSRQEEDRRRQEQMRVEQEKQEAAERLKKQFRQATALRLNADAQAMLSGIRPDGSALGLRMLLTAYRMEPSIQIEAVILRTTLEFQHVEKIVDTDSGITAIAFSPDGTMVVVGQEDGVLRLRDVQTWRVIGKPVKGHAGYVASVAFRSDGGQLVSGGGDGTLRLWNSQTGRPIGEPFRGHLGRVNSVTFSPDGKRAISGGEDKTLRLWDVQTKREIGRFFKSRVTVAAFSPDGKRLIVGEENGSLQLWDVDNSVVIGEPFDRRHVGRVTSVAFSPDGERIVSGGEDKVLYQWTAKTGRTIKEPVRGHGGHVISVAFSSDGLRTISIGISQELGQWDLQTGRVIAESVHHHPKGISSVAFSPDGTKVIFCGKDGTLQLLDVKTRRAIGQPFRGHSGINTIAVFTVDGTRIVSMSRDKTFLVWDVGTQRNIGKPARAPGRDAYVAAFSRDGTKVIFSDIAGPALLWDVQKGIVVGEPFQGKIWTVGFSFDGRRVISDSDAGTLQLWDVETKRAIGAPFRGHAAHVTSVAFSPDGTQVISGMKDGGLQLWDVESKRAIGGPFRINHISEVTGVAFSPDGTRVISCDDYGWVDLWPAPKLWLNLLCDKLTRNMSRKEWCEHVSSDMEYIEQCPRLPIPDDKVEEEPLDSTENADQ